MGEWDLLASSWHRGSLFWNLPAVHLQLSAARLGQDTACAGVNLQLDVKTQLFVKTQLVLQPSCSPALTWTEGSVQTAAVTVLLMSFSSGGGIGRAWLSSPGFNEGGCR